MRTRSLVVTEQAREEVAALLASAVSDETLAASMLPSISLSTRSMAYYAERLRLAKVQLGLEQQFGASYIRQQMSA